MLRAIDIVKEYKSDSGLVRALDGVSLDVSPGERIGVLGSNGSGKSTLIRILGRIEPPTSGKIIRDMSVSWPLAFRGGFNVELSGYDNLRFLSRIYEKPFEPLAAFVEDFTELGSRLKDPIWTYSSGMKAKLSFGLSFAVEFDCYLIDEVFAVGDQQFRRKCKQELFDKRNDRALLMVSHQAAAIQMACTTGILIQDGRYVDTFDIASDKNWRKHARAS